MAKAGICRLSCTIHYPLALEGRGSGAARIDAENPDLGSVYRLVPFFCTLSLKDYVTVCGTSGERVATGGKAAVGRHS